MATIDHLRFDGADAETGLAECLYGLTEIP